jgi:hypothetical protein
VWGCMKRALSQNRVVSGMGGAYQKRRDTVGELQSMKFQ